MNDHPVLNFINAVRLRLDRGVAALIGARCLLATAGACVLWALAWRVFGYAAPWVGYGVAVAVGLGAYFIVRTMSKRSDAQAARAADEVFGLKDGLLSWIGFRAKDSEGEVFELQEKSIATKLTGLELAAVPVPKPRRQYLSGGLLSVIAVVLALLPHSQAVSEQLALEELTAERSAEVKKQVEEAVEELIDQLNEEERKVLDPAKLREMAQQIKETEDQREAEKQIAKFEQELTKAIQGLEARQDQAVLKLAAAELAKSSEADLRKLGKQLEAKDFEMAKEQLEQMKLGDKPPMTPEEIEKLKENAELAKEMANQEPKETQPGEKSEMSPEELEQLKEKAAKAKEMAKRMAEGARQREFGKPPKPGDNKDAADMPMAQSNQKPMQEMLDEMDAQARQLDQQMQQMEPNESDPNAQKAAKQMAQQMDGKMDELAKRLSQMGARQKAQQKMDQLRQGMCQAREFAQGKCGQLGLGKGMNPSQNPGGLPPGKGSVESRRSERDELKDNGNMTQLKGQANPDGPSSNSVESAENGTGIAGRSGVDNQRDFQRQMESLVRRDDIPEELKLGVREYFERVHETGEPSQE